MQALDRRRGAGRARPPPHAPARPTPPPQRGHRPAACPRPRTRLTALMDREGFPLTAGFRPSLTSPAETIAECEEGVKMAGALRLGEPPADQPFPLRPLAAFH